MEDRKYDPNEKDTSAAKNSPERRRDGESLFQYFLRKREASEAGQSDDKETESSEESTTKRRWKLFKGFFSNVVADPSKESDKSAEQREAPILPLAWGSVESTNYAPTETPQVEASDNIDSTPNADPGISNEATAVPESSGELADVPTAELPQEPEQSNTEADTPILTSEATYPTPGQTLEYQQAFAPDEAITQTPTVVERERVVERGVGLALPVVLVGAEYFARKRADRKLDRKFETKTELMKKDMNRGELARDQLDSLVRQNRDQLERLKQERGVQQPSVEARPAPEIRTTKEAPEIRKPGPEANRQQYQQERREVRATPYEQAERREVVQAENKAETTEVQTRSERIIERSHEIKDDHTVPSAPSVGAIMAAQAAQKQAAASQNMASQTTYDPLGLPVIADSRSAEVYKQAMRAGFWAAVTIIIFGLLAYLMVK